MNILKRNAKDEFNVDIITSTALEKAQQLWNDLVTGQPEWVNDNVISLNFAKFICYYTSKKVCMDIAVSVEGSERADYINKCISAMLKKQIRDKVEDACGLGGIMFKPNGNSNPNNAIDYVLPFDFAITEKTSNGDITGAIFIDKLQKGKDYYTRLEYHHFVDAKDENGEKIKGYVIENKTYKSTGKNTLGEQVAINTIPEWAEIAEKTPIMTGLEKPLFAYFKMPYNNTIDYASPEGVSVFANCIHELKDLDIAWNMKSNEVEDSQHITFIDESAITQRGKSGERVSRTELPRFVKGLRKGVDAGSTIDEHIPHLLTEQRIADINSILSMISTKAGFSQGQFVLDRKTGQVTATQIESDDNETVETINDIRESLKTAIEDLVYALNAYCDLNGVPVGYVNMLDDEVPEEDKFYFKDLLATFEQDRTRAYQLMLQGIYSKKKYLTEYEGFSAEEAEEMLKEAQAEVVENAQLSQSLFGEE